jgi:hypothetical protein
METAMLTRSIRRLLLSSVAVLGLTLGSLPAAAGHADDDDEYDDRHSRRHFHGRSCGHDEHDHYRHEHRGTGHGRRVYRAPARFIVPTVIRPAAVGVYEPYYRGEAWYAPHRHDHDVYYFPVAVEHGYVYEPHFYCRGGLFRHQVAYAGPRLRLSLGF